MRGNANGAVSRLAVLASTGNCDEVRCNSADIGPWGSAIRTVLPVASCSLVVSCLSQLPKFCVSYFTLCLLLGVDCFLRCHLGSTVLAVRSWCCAGGGLTPGRPAHDRRSQHKDITPPCLVQSRHAYARSGTMYHVMPTATMPVARTALLVLFFLHVTNQCRQDRHALMHMYFARTEPATCILAMSGPRP